MLSRAGQREKLNCELQPQLQEGLQKTPQGAGKLIWLFRYILNLKLKPAAGPLYSRLDKSVEVG